MLFQREPVAFETADAGCEWKPANVGNAPTSHRDKMLRCNSADGAIVDAHKIGAEAGEETIDQDEGNPLFSKLFEFCRREAAGGND